MRKQKSWLDRLSSAARWRLGAKEAEEVIADYREIVGDPPRRSEELTQELGKPLDAVKPLTDPKAYRIWLAVYVLAMAAALVSLELLAPLWWMNSDAINRLRSEYPAYLGRCAAMFALGLAGTGVALC